jgi:hypothetical protein
MRRFWNNLLRDSVLRVGRPWSVSGTVGASRGASPRGTFKPQLEALERREVLTATTTALLTAPPTSVLANIGPVLAHPVAVAQPTGAVSNVAFSGKTAIEVVSLPTLGRPSTPKTVQTLNVKDTLFGLYNSALPTTTSAISSFLSVPANTGGRRLYNIQLTLPQANPSDLLTLSVSPQNKTFTLVYFSETCTLNCKVDSGHFFVPDPSMHATFNMVLTMNFTTSAPLGTPANSTGPIALTSASIGFTHAFVHLSGLFVTDSDAQSAANALNNGHGDATAAMNKAMAAALAVVNSTLIHDAPQSPLTPTQVVVTPSFDAAHSQFVLTVSSAPSTAPVALAVAQGPVSSKAGTHASVSLDALSAQ